MRVVIQRAKQSKVTVNNNVVGKISFGLVILVGIEENDTNEDADWLANKIVNLRIFDDEKSVMNKSLTDVNGELLVISQFTLHAKTKKGNRPSFIKSAKPEISEPLYKYFTSKLSKLSNTKVQTGQFGAHMEVFIQNDGPVTIIIDTKNKE